MVSFTSYMFQYCLMSSVKANNTRYEIIQKCRSLELEFHSVIVTASPFAEPLHYKGEFGSYYKKVIEPNEINALKNGAEAILKENPDQIYFTDSKEEIVQLRKKYRSNAFFEELDFQQGKVEMFKYAIGYFTYSHSD